MASSFNLLGNPELDRTLRINLPARRLLFIAGFALAVVLVIAGLQWSSYSSRYYSSFEQMRRFGRDTYWMLTVILFGLLFVLSPAMTALSFIQEKLRGTAIFQQMVLIKPLDIAIGKFLGSGAASYFAAMVVLPFALVAALLGFQSPERVFSLYLFLFVGGLSFQAVGLFASAAISSPADKGLRGGLLVGPGIGALGAITALYCYRYFDPNHFRTSYYNWRFYGIRVEAYVVVLALLVFIGLWAFAGAVRRIKASQLVPVKAWPVWLFFVTAEALLVGILWGWQPSHSYDLNTYGTAPVLNLIFYMVINWAALLTLAGSIALSRNRLREWWSAGSDPLGLYQRAEVRNNFKTFIIALAISIAGLIALWMSYHADADDFPRNIALTQLVPIVLGFAFTILGTLFFVQYSAMQRFRARAWAGVGLVVAFYLMMSVVGLIFKGENNTANLLNPAIYAYEITRGDPYMDRVSVKYHSYTEPKVEFHQVARVLESSGQSTLIFHGLLAEGLLAMGCFGLAFLKWRKIEDEMMES